ncbi:hypothetical protein DXD76_15890, partial [Firmicutes bacterium TM09-10]
PEICLHLPSDSTSQWTPLVLAVSFPLLGWIGDFHPLETCAARRTTIKKPECFHIPVPVACARRFELPTF